MRNRKRLLLVAILGALAPGIAWAQQAQPVRITPPGYNSAGGLLVAGQKTTNTSNGSEALASTTAVLSVSLKAQCANTVDVHVGPTAVNASSSKGRTLAPCETLDLDVKDLANIFLDSGTTAATVEYLGVTGP